MCARFLINSSMKLPTGQKSRLQEAVLNRSKGIQIQHRCELLRVKTHSHFLHRVRVRGPPLSRQAFARNVQPLGDLSLRSPTSLLRNSSFPSCSRCSQKNSLVLHTARLNQENVHERFVWQLDVDPDFSLGWFPTAVFRPPQWRRNHLKCEALAAGDPCRRRRNRHEAKETASLCEMPIARVEFQEPPSTTACQSICSKNHNVECILMAQFV